MTSTGIIQDSIPGPHALNNAISYDPDSDLFWCASQQEDLVAVNRNGEEIQRFNHSLNIQGLSWFPYDPEGMPLYISSITNDGQGARTAIAKMNPATGDYRILRQLDESDDGNLVIGHTISRSINGHELMWTHAAIIFNSSNGNTVLTHNLSNNLTYLECSPRFGELDMDIEIPVSLHFDAFEMEPGYYEGYVEFLETNIGDVERLSYTLHVVNVEADQTTQPNEFSISNSYPNPFNPSTSWKIKTTKAETVVLTVFNLAGRQVSRQKIQLPSAGSHQVSWTAPAGLASGLYIANITAEQRSSTQKLLLLK